MKGIILIIIITMIITNMINGDGISF